MESEVSLKPSAMMAWPVAFAACRLGLVNIDENAVARDVAAASVKQVLVGYGCHHVGGCARTPAAKTGRRRALICMVVVLFFVRVTSGSDRMI